ncbi:hypothetical protein ACGFJ7_09780 [Actinoplanes sp. NPDC048988]|uniref:hypothetical protein n=1 Tax=Actinoplanes sp. NPDC048988 TaxID=3363901 RepID=UPI0037129532
MVAGPPWTLITMWAEPNTAAVAVFPVVSLLPHFAAVWRAESGRRRRITAGREDSFTP